MSKEIITPEVAENPEVQTELLSELQLKEPETVLVNMGVEAVKKELDLKDDQEIATVKGALTKEMGKKRPSRRLIKSLITALAISAALPAVSEAGWRDALRQGADVANQGMELVRQRRAEQISNAFDNLRLLLEYSQRISDIEYDGRIRAIRFELEQSLRDFDAERNELGYLNYDMLARRIKANEPGAPQAELDENAVQAERSVYRAKIEEIFKTFADSCAQSKLDLRNLMIEELRNTQRQEAREDEAQNIADKLQAAADKRDEDLALARQEHEKMADMRLNNIEKEISDPKFVEDTPEQSEGRQRLLQTQLDRLSRESDRLNDRAGRLGEATQRHRERTAADIQKIADKLNLLEREAQQNNNFRAATLEFILEAGRDVAEAAGN